MAAEASGVRLTRLADEPAPFAGGQKMPGVWFRIDPQEAVIGRRWFRMRYRASLFDPCQRPVLRYLIDDGRVIDHPMNATFLGAAEFIDRTPPGAQAAFLLAPGRDGETTFLIDAIEPIRRPSLFLRGLAGDPKWLALGLGARLLGSRVEARQIVKFAATGTPLSDYDRWLKRVWRPLDLAGIDRPPESVTKAGVSLAAPLLGDAAGLMRTYSSLVAAGVADWTLSLVISPGTTDTLRAAAADLAVEDPRVSVADAATPFGALRDDRLVGLVTLGDKLMPCGLALMAAEAARLPSALIYYGDEDRETAQGRRHSPCLKPDWSPYYFEATRYLGRLVLTRPAALRTIGRAPEDLFAAEEETVAALARHAPVGTVAHVRRLIYRRRAAKAPDLVRAPARPAEPATWPLVSVVIPTRDRHALLKACTDGLFSTTDYPAIETILVDNETAETDARSLLVDLASRPGVTVLRSPGKFNYSKLCNEGARTAKGEILVFLNNDVAMDRPDWLKPLVAWALQPGVGAVGAKLLFPDRKLQHVGVVLGVGGIAGHCYRGADENERGYLDRIAISNEQAAVTGACLAVARDKFEAIGGYDETNLPVELNDTDLCLRLGERGWTTIWTPDCVLFHRESASRGRQLRPFEVYGQERHYFRRRWGQIIRDDPYFHPALSLFGRKVSLA